MIEGRLQVPPTVRRGEAFQVRILIQHPMETGYRRDMDGRAVPINVVDTVVCRYGGAEILRAQLGSGVSANPYLAFYAVAEASGEVVVEFSDDRGEKGRVAAMLTVT
jgi:sulfur-oxidizing protein SoxZ